MLEDDELEIYELAYHLHMPVVELVNRMTYEEFLGWFDYFNKRPPQWRDDLRASMIMAAQGVKVKPEKIFGSLAIMKKHSENKEKTELQKIKGSDMIRRMMMASGGESPAFLKELL